MKYSVRGSDEWLPGFSTNLSATGMFLATRKLQSKGARVRVEFIDPSLDFTLEGEVRWGRRVPPALTSVSPSGFGIRFLEVGELMRELVDDDRAVSEVAAMPMPGVASGRDARGEPPSPAPDGPGAPVYQVGLQTSPRFLDTFEREIIAGALFIETTRLVDVQTPVTVELLLPPPAGVVTLPAYVVLRIDPDTPGSGGMTGVAVEFFDRRAVLEKLGPTVEQLEAERD